MMSLRRFWGTLGFLVTAPLALQAGIATPFSELKIKNLQVGRVYVGSRDVTPGMPYRAENRMDQPVDFVVEALVPTPDQLKENYEPIPDVSWISFQNKFMTGEGGKNAETEYYIAIPDDDQYLGRNFQAQLAVRTVGGGNFLQMGLVGRAMLSVHPERLPQSTDDMKKHRLTTRFRFSSLPADPIDMSFNQKISLEQLFGHPCTVTNDSDTPLSATVESVYLNDSFSNPPIKAVPAPDLSLLKIKTKKIKVPPHGQKTIEGYIMVPDHESHRKRIYTLVIRVKSRDKRAPVEIFAPFFIRTPATGGAQ